MIDIEDKDLVRSIMGLQVDVSWAGEMKLALEPVMRADFTGCGVIGTWLTVEGGSIGDCDTFT